MRWCGRDTPRALVWEQNMLVLSWLPPLSTLGAGHLAQHLPAVHAVDPLAAFGAQLQRSASLAVLQLKFSFGGFIDRLHPSLLSAGTKKALLGAGALQHLAGLASIDRPV